MLDDVAIVVLAGGNARRFPGKLEHLVDGEPMLLRAYRAMRATGRPVYVAGKGSFSRALDDALDCPLLVDRWPGAGPLVALLSACGEIPHARIFALAADQPAIDASLIEHLARAWEPGDRAAVPEHERGIEPLAALYDRDAILSEAFDLAFVAKQTSMRALVERLGARRVRTPGAAFVNVNTPADARRLRGARR